MGKTLGVNDLEIVYHDEIFGRAWITKEWSSSILKYLKDKGFYEKNAIEIKEWMKQRIKENDAYKSVIVFSQDIVPTTILDIKSPNALIRRYLDLSGRIIWIGDHPFWYRSNNSGVRDDIWKDDVHFSMLGKQMLMAECSSHSEWVYGWREKMKSCWYSQRPINMNISEEPYDPHTYRTRIQLKYDVLAYAYVILSPSPWNAFVISRWKAGTKIGSISLGGSILGSGGNVSVTLAERLPKELSLKPQKLACSWHVIFNEKYPNQGFYRLWDYDSIEDDPPIDLLEDIFTLATIKK